MKLPVQLLCVNKNVYKIKSWLINGLQSQGLSYMTAKIEDSEN
jgi:hypothetical protein